MQQKDTVACPVADCSYTGSLSRVIHHITTESDSNHTWEALGYQYSYEFRKNFEESSKQGDTPKKEAQLEKVDADNISQPVALEDVPGIGSTRAESLQESGYEYAADVANALITELSEVRMLNSYSAKCIRTTAREECGYQDPFITSLAKNLNVDREQVSDAYAELAPFTITPDEAEETIERVFVVDNEQSILRLSGHSLHYRHNLFQAGFETIEAVATASIEALTQVSYIGETVAENIRKSARNTSESSTPTDSNESSIDDSNQQSVQNSNDASRSTPPNDTSDPTNTEQTDESSHSQNTATAKGVETETYSDDELRDRGRELLEQSIGPNAEFRPDQWEAIRSLVRDKDRLLLVQRTGWGKSTVYFIATKLLREQGSGPTLIISPLLALMYNQVQDASEQLDLNAWTINSNNTDEWTEAAEAIENDDCDLLLISPERLANIEFRDEVLSSMTKEFGMFVVDEAHCISDWGHDFRPDYQRIKRILKQLPEHVPVAATTATANDRVVDDVTDQVPGLCPIRGDLVRDSLRIQTIEMDSRTERMAWLAENLPKLSASGIVYCLTTDEVETVANWLQEQGIDVKAYHGGMKGEHRRKLETQLMNNEVDGLVATNALGMGFNKPDLGWVIHFQRPPNLIRYYQEIGRAGRALDEAFAVLLSGKRDDDIAEYFIEQAFPEQETFETILQTIEDSDKPLGKRQILNEVDVSWNDAGKCLDILRIDNAIIRIDAGYERTSASWSYDHERIESVTQHRWEELEKIKEFVHTDRCLTKFIDDELDGSLSEACGQCANCTNPFLPTTVENDEMADHADTHYRTQSWDTISPRYYNRTKDGRSKIAEDRKPEPGRVLSRVGDPGYGQLVSQAQTQNEIYSEELVKASVEHISTNWNPTPAPKWVTAVPQPDNSKRVTHLAQRVASELGADYVDAITTVRDFRPQEEFNNSYQQRWNVHGAFEATTAVRSAPVLLIDDTFRSRWTFTEAAMMLRDAESGLVYPFALAERSR